MIIIRYKFNKVVDINRGNINNFLGRYNKFKVKVSLSSFNKRNFNKDFFGSKVEVMPEVMSEAKSLSLLGIELISDVEVLVPYKWVRKNINSSGELEYESKYLERGHYYVGLINKRLFYECKKKGVECLRTVIDPYFWKRKFSHVRLAYLSPKNQC